MKILIKNGRVIDPASGTDDNLDILIEDEKIKEISGKISSKKDTEVIDATGCLVLPGLIDMHVHFREPGREELENIISGSKAAAKGGFTSVCTMPNTDPVIDNKALVRFIKFEAEKGPINVYPIATISKGARGEEISEMGGLIEGGAVAFSDDGLPVSSSLLMRRALEYSRMFDVPILTHAEDLDLTDNGIMNEGDNSTLLGIKGIPKESEEIIVARDVMLTRLVKGKLHVCHVSSGGSVDIIKHAKEQKVNVTCETAPHYFTLTDSSVREKLSMAKMNPPLRTEADRKEIIEGLRNGAIDVIATDHAPHSVNEKMQEIEYAPFGVIGLETAVPLIITVLVKENDFTYLEAFKKVTVNPARILNLENGELKKDRIADITIIDPEKKVHIDDSFFISRCKNSPYIGMDLFGNVEYTICRGNVVYSDRLKNK